MGRKKKTIGGWERGWTPPRQVQAGVQTSKRRPRRKMTDRLAEGLRAAATAAVATAAAAANGRRRATGARKDAAGGACQPPADPPTPHVQTKRGARQRPCGSNANRPRGTRPAHAGGDASRTAGKAAARAGPAFSAPAPPPPRRPGRHGMTAHARRGGVSATTPHPPGWREDWIAWAPPERRRPGACLLHERPRRRARGDNGRPIIRPPVLASINWTQ